MFERAGGAYGVTGSTVNSEEAGLVSYYAIFPGIPLVYSDVILFWVWNDL